MSRCDMYFNNQPKGKYYKKPADMECALCRPEPVCEPELDPCVCPPIGCPKDLRIIAPVIFDECGINLCKVVERDVLKKYSEADSVQLRVLDINFNVSCSEDGSKVEFIADRPNCIKIKLSNICVKFAVKVLDCCCNIIDTFCIDELFLPDECDPEYDEETNPECIYIDLFAPYGVAYNDEYEELIPNINFLGFLENGEGYRNNDLRQGLDAQALATAVKYDPCRGCLAIGLTIYLKTVYFIQYKIPHNGLVVPPKCRPEEICPEYACKDFVEGDLLEQNIMPLPLCEPCGCDPCGPECGPGCGPGCGPECGCEKPINDCNACDPYKGDRRWQ